VKARKAIAGLLAQGWLITLGRGNRVIRLWTPGRNYFGPRTTRTRHRVVKIAGEFLR
jgi:hypothetical protein